MILRRLLAALCIMLSPMSAAWGHALEPAYLDIRHLAGDSWQVFWRKPDVAGKPMTIDVKLPDNCSPTRAPDPRFDGAAWVAAWVSDCPLGLVGRTVEISGLESQRTDALLRFQTHTGATTTVRLTPTQTTYLVPAEPTVLNVLTSYFQLGFEHILEGWDHLLFVFALLILIRDVWRLVGAITAFTLAHSITLALAALGHISIPGPPVEAIIALSIVFLAVEVLKRDDGQKRLSERSPWLIAFAFGLLHGLGFAGALRDIGLPESDVPAALVAFNLGVEAGQLVFVLGVIAIGSVVRLAVPFLARQWQQASSGLNSAMGYAIGGMATYWLAERLAYF